MNVDAATVSSMSRRDQARRWLRHIRRLEDTIQTIQDELYMQNELLNGLRAVQNDGMRVSGSTYYDRIPEALNRIEACIREYCDEVEAYSAIQKDAHDRISKLPNRLHVDVLKRSYLLGESQEEIAKKLMYSCGYIGRVKADALEAAFAVMPEEWKMAVE